MGNGQFSEQIMSVDNLEIVSVPVGALTLDELQTLKKVARAYKALGWILGVALSLSSGVLVFYDLAHSVSSTGSH
jgi:hypothetical protein